MTQILKLESKKILKGDLKNGHINTVAFSPDGKYVVSGSYDNTVRIWDVATGNATHTYVGHSNWINSVAFSPDGINVASGSNDNTARIWEVESNQEMHTLEEHIDAVESVAFSSPDGKYLVTGDRNTACIWDVDIGTVEKKLEGHTDFINSVAFSPDEKYVVSGSEDKTVRIWNVVSGQEMHILKGHRNAVRSVGVSPDGKCVVSGSFDKTIRIWDVISGKEIYKLKMNSPIVSVAFSPDITSGYTFAFTIEDSTIHLYNLISQISSYKFHTSLNSKTSIESVSLPSKADDFIVGPQSLSEYEYDIKDSDYPILFTDKKFPMKVLMKSRLEKILKDNHSIFYKCKAETKTTSLLITKENVHPQPYIKTTVFGLETVGDALIKIENIKNILKDSKKIRLKNRQKQAIRKLGEEISINEENMTQRDMVKKANSVLKTEKIPPRIYTFVETVIEIDRVASKAVIESRDVVSAKHCQRQDKMKVYTLRQVYKKRTKKRKYPKKSTSISRKNKSL